MRQAHHFEHLTEHVIYPLLENAKEKRLRIWSAGCSWGAEPYSIAMVLAQLMRGRSGWDARILATDIDTNMLAKAQAGEFENAQLEKIPLAFRHYCRSGSQTGHFKIDQQVKQYITFKPLNLLHDWPMKGRFDVIFCRNVVIYFDKPTQATLFNRMHDIITPKGWLYIGHSESLFKVCDSFTLAGKTIYQKA